MLLARGLVTFCCLICAMAGDCPGGSCSQGRRTRGTWTTDSTWIDTNQQGPQFGTHLDVKAPLGSTVRILPAAGEPITYRCSSDHALYGLNINTRPPYRVEARGRDGVLLDYSVISDTRTPIKLINSLDPRSCREPVDVNYGLATDTEGHPVFGMGPLGNTTGHNWYGDEVLPDHRGKKTLTVICDDCQEREKMIRALTTGNFALMTNNLVLLDYPTNTWHVRDHKVPTGSKAIVVQEAQPSAKVLHRQADFDLNTLGTALCSLQDIKPPQEKQVEAVRTPDPSYRPELDPNLGQRAGAELKIGLVIAAAIAMFFLLTLRPKES